MKMTVGTVSFIGFNYFTLYHMVLCNVLALLIFMMKLDCHKDTTVIAAVAVNIKSTDSLYAFEVDFSQFPFSVALFNV